MGVRGLDPWKCVRGVRVCFDPLEMSRSFIQNCCWITLQVSHHQGWKTYVKNWKVKLIIRGVYRLPGTKIVEFLEIIDVGLIWNSSMAWLTLTPIFYDASTPLAPYICVLLLFTAFFWQCVIIADRHWGCVRLCNVTEPIAVESASFAAYLRSLWNCELSTPRVQHRHTTSETFHIEIDQHCLSPDW